MEYESWKIPTEFVQLRAEEVHVWRASLRQQESVQRRMWECLNEGEQKRAERYRFAKDKQAFIVARGVLRHLLSSYIHDDPCALEFVYNTYGKPELVGEQSRLQFNVSHSHDMVLYAFSWGRELGIDIEYMRADIGYEEIARYSFSQEEQKRLANVAQSQLREAFYRCWTRKEAYIKARGMGLSLDLKSFDVSLQEGERALLWSREGEQERARWQYRDLYPKQEYAASLLVEGDDWQVKYWDWQAESQP